MLGGAISKASNNVALTTNYLKLQLNIPLGPEELRVEDAFMKGQSGN